MVAFAESPDAFKVETDGNLGAVEIATFLSLVLLGISLSQGYTYFRRSSRDSRGLKAMVTILLTMEVFHSFTASHTIYYDTVTRWNSAEINSYSLSANVATETLITFLVQCFFCHRILRLSKNIFISGACIVLTSLRFLGGLAMSAECVIDVHRTPNWVTFITDFNWLVTSALALGGATDLLIAAAMLYYLRRMASPTNMKSTTQMINRLVRFSLQTGLFTSLASLAVIICFQAMRNLVWFGLYIVLAKIYSNSLLASLNARRLPRRSSTSPNLRGGISTHMDFATAPPAVS
ncbi:hypothetical protein CPC08DRAFT_226309 [Agrocybe pediades]|nr:hypothetical protein CPC08DRAFT_226309 [Agrocybe pediades]